MNIKEAEILSGVSKRNIRFYEQKGLLSPDRNKENDYREYSEEDIEKLKLIRALRMLDMPLEQVREVVLGNMPMREAVTLHKGKLRSRMKEIETAIRFCEELSAEEKPDLDAVLCRMEQPENRESLSKRGDRDYADALIGIVAPLLAGLLACGAGALFGMLVLVFYTEVPAIGYVFSTMAYVLWGSFGYWVQKQGNWLKNCLLIHVIPIFAWLSYWWMLVSDWQTGLLDMVAVYGYLPILFAGLPYMILLGGAEFMTWLPLVLLVMAFGLGGMVGWLWGRWKGTAETVPA